jgi:hypothetical protein
MASVLAKDAHPVHKHALRGLQGGSNLLPGRSPSEPTPQRHVEDEVEGLVKGGVGPHVGCQRVPAAALPAADLARILDAVHVPARAQQAGRFAFLR